MANKKLQTGLFFGSFNPPHVGHMVIANFLINHGNLNELWFVVSPHNPLKEKKTLLQARTRLELVRTAIGDFQHMAASDIEFNLPAPNYTIQTLVHLEEKYPGRCFSLIMGMDNLQSLHKWKAWETIISNYRIIVYPRPGYNGEPHIQHENVQIVAAPLMEISSSFIREEFAKGRDPRFFLPASVASMIQREGLYESN